MYKRLITLLLIIQTTCLADGLLNVDVKEHVLENGLKILMVEDHYAPSVACRLFYKIGSVNEQPGISGASHMFEHMMFKGTKRIGVIDWPKDSALLVEIDRAWSRYDSARKTDADTAVINRLREEFKTLQKQEKPLLNKEELWNLYLQNGGTGLNAFTTDILTAYFVTLPKNKIELFFWLESDRVRDAVLREFYSEREVVAEERRLRYENRPDGRYWETLNALFYEAHPYRIPTIGWMSDIMNYDKETLRRRFRQYYRPDNLIMVIAGDFETQHVIELAEKYFGPIPRNPEKVPPVTVEEPKQIGEKRFTVKKEASPRVDIIFHTPGLGDPDLYALDIIEGVLSGRNGRLYKILVKEKELCTNTGAGNGVEKYTSYFRIFADLKESADPAEVEAIILEELEKLKTEPLSDYELERVKNNAAATAINLLRRPEETANQLGFWEAKGDWRYINRWPAEVLKVKKDAVKTAAEKYFTFNNRTVGTLIREIKQ